VDFYLEVLKRYADFNGRAGLKEFWMFTLFNIIVTIVLNIVGGLIHLAFLGTLYSLAVLLPNLAVGARRLHDRDMSGWMLLIGLIPVFGGIALIVIFCLDGTPGDNRFGPKPNGAVSVATS